MENAYASLCGQPNFGGLCATGHMGVGVCMNFVPKFNDWLASMQPEAGCQGVLYKDGHCRGETLIFGSNPIFDLGALGWKDTVSSIRITECSRLDVDDEPQHVSVSEPNLDLASDNLTAGFLEFCPMPDVEYSCFNQTAIIDQCYRFLPETHILTATMEVQDGCSGQVWTGPACENGDPLEFDENGFSDTGSTNLPDAAGSLKVTHCEDPLLENAPNKIGFDLYNVLEPVQGGPASLQNAVGIGESAVTKGPSLGHPVLSVSDDAAESASFAMRGVDISF